MGMSNFIRTNLVTRMQLRTCPLWFPRRSYKGPKEQQFQTQESWGQL